MCASVWVDGLVHACVCVSVTTVSAWGQYHYRFWGVGVVSQLLEQPRTIAVNWE